MENLLNQANSFLEQLFVYGPFWIYLAIAFASFLENVFPPFPGDVITIAGGAIAATGRLNIFLVFILACVGGIMSTMIVYYIGLKYGRRYFMRKNFRIFSANDIRKVENWLDQKGAWLLIANRFTVGARTVIALTAGISNYRARPMFVYCFISFLLFNGIILALIYFFVANFEKIINYYETYQTTVLVLLIVAALAFVGWQILRQINNGKEK